MAFYSNKFRTLSNVKAPFISSDDIGISEILKAGDSKYAKLFGHKPISSSEENEKDDYEYYDDCTMDVGFRFKERPFMSARLEKIDQAKKKRAKMKNIRWETSRVPLSQEELDDLFKKKEIQSDKLKLEKTTSKLSKLILNHSDIPQNPYKEYAKFDGSWQYTVPTKTYKIYITMLPPEQRNYPMEICCISSAKIHELIGFIVFKYSSQYGTTNLLPVSYYNLYITEDDGEVDRDLPYLDRREPSSKFGFTYLGLVQEDEPCEPDNLHEVIPHFMSIEEQLERNRFHKNPEQTKVEKERRMESDIRAIERNNKLMEAPLYRSYRAFMITKIKLKIEVNIGISWQRVEIDPVPQKMPKFLPFKLKAVCYPMDSVVYCYVTERKSSKIYFRIVYCTDNTSNNISSSPSRGYNGIFAVASGIPRSLKFWSNFKHCDFETDVTPGEEIVSKIESILELKCSNRSSEYKSSRKFAKRKGFLPAY